MKKLIFKSALLLFLVGTVLYAGGAAYRGTNTYKNLEHSDDTERYHALPDTVDIAVFGSSHGRDSFQYYPEGKTFFNFSITSQTPEYSLRVMREYRRHIRSGALVIIVISPMYPFFQQRESDFLAQQSRYYRILSPGNIIDVDMPRWLCARFSPLLTEDLPQIISAFSQNVELSPTSDALSGYRQFSPENLPAETNRIKHSHIAEDLTTFPAESPSMMPAYREMLLLAQEQNWNAVLVTPPYLEEYLSCYYDFSEQYFDVFRKTITAVSEEFNVPFWDYSHNSAYTARYDLFQDIDHLNLAGAELFDRQFFSDIQSEAYFWSN